MVESLLPSVPGQHLKLKKFGESGVYEKIINCPRSIFRRFNVERFRLGANEIRFFNRFVFAKYVSNVPVSIRTANRRK